MSIRSCAAEKRSDKTADVKAIIFDLDGVLTNTSEYHYRAWKRLADELSILFTRADNESLRGVSRRHSLELLLGDRKVTEEQAQEMMARKNRYYQEFIQQVTPDDMLPGALELLQECRRAGVKVAIGSASRNTRAVVERLSIGHLVDAIADGYSVARQKPAPDLFLRAAEMLGVSPANCIVVEDAAVGVEAALAGGFWAIGLGPEERVGAANLVFPDLAGVTLNDIRRIRQRATSIQHPVMTYWHITETEFNPDILHHKETVFTIGNGYLGTRGAFEEGYPDAWPATLVHGVFDDAPQVYTELANVPNWLPFLLFVNGERFGMDRGTLLSYKRDLNLKTGLLSRTVRWRSPAGHTLDLAIERFASLADRHLLSIRYRVTALDSESVLEFRAGLDGHVENAGLVHWRLVDQGPALSLSKGAVGQQGVYLHVRTRGSGIELCEACYLTLRVEPSARASGRGPQGEAVSGGESVTYTTLDCECAPAVVAHLTLRPGEQVTADKLVALVTSHEDRDDDVREAALSRLEEAILRGYDDLRAANEAAWEPEWEACNVTIEGDDEADLALRYNLFQLLIAAPRHDERVSIPAKTLSGFGYRGHVFWDTDTFIIPFFACTRPGIARNLLLYRYHTLPGARRKARHNGYEGAMFAWESADSGDETTPRWMYVPDGELVRIWCGDIEHHISADVAYAVFQYWRVTGDDDFVRDYGAEILLDTACFWGSRVEWDDERGRYEINDVIGPDEYHEHVNNNVFTNCMARWNLEAALEVLAWLRREYPEKAAELEARLHLTQERLSYWAGVIDCLYVAHDPETGLMEQFEGFFDLNDVDLADYEPRRISMQALLGIEEAQRYQVLKQPDVLMLLYLLRDRYDQETLRINWDYYTPRTDLTYGSSLGPSIHALLAARLGEPEAAYEHFMHAAWTDLKDVRGNATDGIHAALAGGLWQAVVFGFAGLELNEEGYTVNPQLPAHWKRLSFSIFHRGEKVVLALSHHGSSKGGDATLQVLQY